MLPPSSGLTGLMMDAASTSSNGLHGATSQKRINHLHTRRRENLKSHLYITFMTNSQKAKLHLSGVKNFKEDFFAKEYKLHFNKTTKKSQSYNTL
jgi:hypothetical protein